MRDNADNETDLETKKDLESKAIKYGHKANVKIAKINARQIEKIKKDEKKPEKTEELGNK